MMDKNEIPTLKEAMEKITDEKLYENLQAVCDNILKNTEEQPRGGLAQEQSQA